MSKPSNPTLIGSFVLGAVLLLVVAVLVFGGAALFVSKRTLVSYFPGSVQGLREGSSVVINGVRVGYVKDIRLEGELKPDHSMEMLVGVTMEVLPSSFELYANGAAMSAESRARLSPDQYVQAGIRAKLATESYVTGQLLVELDFEPNTPAVYRARQKGGPPEIPSVPGDVQQVLERVQTFFARISDQVDVETLAKDIQGILNGLNQLANSPDLRTMLSGGSRLANDDIPRLTSSLERSLNELQGATKDARTLVRHVDDQVDPLMADLLPAVRRLDATLKSTEQTLQSVSGHLREDSALSVDVRNTLQDLQSMSDAATALLQYLDEHPEALLRGKQKRDGE
jgi:paraquat-inducible protein B